MKCCVYKCRSNSNAPKPVENKISFHTFPSDENLKKKWVEALKKKNWAPTKYSRVCCLHFNKKDILRTFKGRSIIREGAFPQLLIYEKQYDDKTPEPFNIEEFVVFQDTPRTKDLKVEIARLLTKEKVQRLKINSLQRNLQRLKKKMTSRNGNMISCRFSVKTMQELYKHLQKKNLLSEEEIDILNLTDVNIRDLIPDHDNEIRKQAQYSPTLRMFAITLHYYSPKAYSYVRQKFNACLPDPRTIAKWFENKNGEAGFTAESFDVLKIKSAKSTEKPLCSLMMDEMAIKQHVEWDGNKCYGYVDHGVEVTQNNDNAQEATQALVMLLVCLKERWKIPVGFFLIHSMIGEQRAALVKQCLYKAHDAGVEVASLTMDGCAANISMAKHLGCCLTPTNFKSTFKHPCANYEVAMLFDACHMLKLVRNAFEAKSVLIDYQGNEIQWNYLQQLNKLKDNHIDFHRQKMKVKLASQLFSNTVADALTVCEKNNQSFRNVQATVFFIELINDLFDILNSRNLIQDGFKKPLFEKNFMTTKQFMIFCKHYFMHLAAKGENNPIIESNRKTGFIGFITCIDSIIFLYSRLKETEKKITFLPTHKMSQDHLELLFGVIRAHCRANNNPTVRQFQAAYKKILVNIELKASSLEEIPMLSVSSEKKINLSASRSRMLQMDDEENADDDCIPDDVLLEFDAQLNSIVRDNLRRQTITYIAGFITKFLTRRLKCETCVIALHADKYSDDHDLILTKNEGGLSFPSKDVIQICVNVESSLRALNSNDVSLLNKHKIVTHSMKTLIGQDSFKILNEHIQEQSPFNNHIILLSKSICEKYVDIRFNHIAGM